MMRRKKTPALYLHKASGQWCVNIAGKRIYLGRDRDRAQEAYQREVARWLLRQGKQRAQVNPSELSVSGVLCAYREAVAARLSDSQLKRIDTTSEYLCELYSSTRADQFDQLELQAWRSWLLEYPNRRYPAPAEGQPDGRPRLSRNYVNCLVGVVQTIWTWAASRKLVPVENAMGLRTVKGLHRGEGGVEVPPVVPVLDEVVEATLEHCHRVVAAMILVQQFSGMRPGEVVLMERRYISCSPQERVQPPIGPAVNAVEVDGVLVWVYAPPRHKTEKKNKARIVVLGPRAQKVLQPFLEDRPVDKPLFSPREAAEELLREKGRKVKFARGRVPRDCYDTMSYGNAIQYACKRANRAYVRQENERRAAAGEEPLPADAVLVPAWAANQLRHSAATFAVEEGDYDSAAALLGHTKPDTTSIYATQAIRRAAKLVARQG